MAKLTEEQALEQADAEGLVPLDRFCVVEGGESIPGDPREVEAYDTREEADAAIENKDDKKTYTVVQQRVMVPKQEEDNE